MPLSLLQKSSHTVSLKEVQKNLTGARATDGKPWVNPFDFSPDRKF